MPSMRHLINLIEGQKPVMEAPRKRASKQAPAKVLSAEEQQWADEDAALAAEIALKKQYKVPFTALEQAAADEKYGHEARDALASAYENAGESDGVKLESGEFWRIALQSIALTDAFTMNPHIQKWFEDHGYRW